MERWDIPDSGPEPERPWFRKYDSGRVRFACECGRHWVFDPEDLVQSPAHPITRDETVGRRRVTRARRRLAKFYERLAP